MVDPFCFAFIWFKVQGSGLRWLINTKAHLQRCAFCFAFIWFRVQGSGFRVQGSGLSWRLRRLFDWAMSESDILIMGYQSILRYEGRNRLTCVA